MIDCFIHVDRVCKSINEWQHNDRLSSVCMSSGKFDLIYRFHLELNIDMSCSVGTSRINRRTLHMAIESLTCRALNNMITNEARRSMTENKRKSSLILNK
jgi:hypothetical protein